MKHISLFVLSTFFAFTASAKSVAAYMEFISIVPEIYGYELSEAGLTLQVPSGGCAQRDNFEVVADEEKPNNLRIIRLNQDMCQMVQRYGTKILFTYKELDVKAGAFIGIKAEKVTAFRVPNLGE
ncbi:MAG TPA: hypothetical protein VM901_03885 [Bdellovibrionota bacterium]|jgi:hypothetical protein|nr:hypothetical protein [Bdellovibrionota bacterium]